MSEYLRIGPEARVEDTDINPEQVHELRDFLCNALVTSVKRIRYEMYEDYSYSLKYCTYMRPNDLFDLDTKQRFVSTSVRHTANPETSHVKVSDLQWNCADNVPNKRIVYDFMVPDPDLCFAKKTVYFVFGESAIRFNDAGFIEEVCMEERKQYARTAYSEDVEKITDLLGDVQEHLVSTGRN